MPKISSYANKTTPIGADSVLGTDSAASNATNNMLLSALPVSTPQQTALNLKSPLASPTFTGTVTAPAFAGDVVFDTDVLAVDSTNDRVGINNATPAKDLDVTGEGRFSTGILFGSDTASANTLDDYEEGTFTPAFANIGTGTYSAQVGTYTKIGDLVHCQIHISVASLGSGSGTLSITGFPFTAASTADSHATSSMVYADAWTTGVSNLHAFISSATATATVYQRATTTVAVATHAEMVTGSMIFNISYKV